MRNTILTLAGIIALGTTTLVADGSLVLVDENVMAIAVVDAGLEDSTVGIDVQTNHSVVSVSGNTMAVAVVSSDIYESTVGVVVEDKD